MFMDVQRCVSRNGKLDLRMIQKPTCGKFSSSQAYEPHLILRHGGCYEAFDKYMKRDTENNHVCRSIQDNSKQSFLLHKDNIWTNTNGENHHFARYAYKLAGACLDDYRKDPNNTNVSDADTQMRAAWEIAKNIKKHEEGAPSNQYFIRSYNMMSHKSILESKDVNSFDISRNDYDIETMLTAEATKTNGVWDALINDYFKPESKFIDQTLTHGTSNINLGCQLKNAHVYSDLCIGAIKTSLQIEQNQLRNKCPKSTTPSDLDYLQAFVMSKELTTEANKPEAYYRELIEDKGKTQDFRSYESVCKFSLNYGDIIKNLDTKKKLPLCNMQDFIASQKNKACAHPIFVYTEEQIMCVDTHLTEYMDKLGTMFQDEKVEEMFVEDQRENFNKGLHCDIFNDMLMRDTPLKQKLIADKVDIEACKDLLKFEYDKKFVGASACILQK